MTALPELEFGPGLVAALTDPGTGGETPGTMAASNAKATVHHLTPWPNIHLTNSTTSTSSTYPRSMDLMFV